MTDGKPLILMVDDEPAIGKLVEITLGMGGYRVVATGTSREFLEAFERLGPDLCLLDIRLPDMSGLDLLRKIKERAPDVPVVMLTGLDSAESATGALKSGAFDYIVKPFERERLIVTTRNALTASEQGRELRFLRTQLQEAYSPEMIVGTSPALRALKAQVQKLAASEATVLIRGESGTGKELVARTIHYGGPRARKPFIDVNCAALTESLLESEIFGHEKGAFTGAAARHAGKFEQADAGTIFLDEIGDMPLPTQAKLLRVLQERSFQRVGGTEKIAVNVRVLSATNQPLERAVAEGRFRQDLFYRINTVMVEVPPLRERREDALELARHFLARAAKREGRAVPELSPSAVKALQEHPWPGNVRELENAMHHAVVLCEGSVVEPGHLPRQISSGAAPVPAIGAGMPGENLPAAVEALERRMIKEALEKCGGVKARAARTLGMTERVLAYKLDTYGLTKRPE